MPRNNKRSREVGFREAIDAVRYAPRARFLLQSPAFKEEQTFIDWSKAIDTIERGWSDNDLSRGDVAELRNGAECCPDDGLRKRLISGLHNWQAAHWERFRPEVVQEAVDSLGRHGSSSGSLRRFVETWPQLRDDPQLIAAAMKFTLDQSYGFKAAVADLALLRGSVPELRVVMAAAERRGPDNRGEITRVIGAWAGSTFWGQLMLHLWNGDDEKGAPSEEVRRLAEMLHQIPLERCASGYGITLSRMSGASRAAWRRKFAEAVVESAEIRAAATEALLWFGADAEDYFLQLAAIQANGEGSEAAMQHLLGHPAERVAMRACSALHLMIGAPDPMDILLSRGTGSSAISPQRRSSRTWLNDVRLEQILVHSFASAAESLADQVRDVASSGEEMLVARLFERMSGACIEATRRASQFAREADLGERVRVTLDHRFVGKTEEGKPGLREEGSFSTDVTLIIKATSGSGRTFAERATFIQAKRMKRGSIPTGGEHYDVDVQQIRDIADQTASSFLLAVGPCVMGVAMPVMPARLFLDKFDEGRNSKRLDLGTMARYGRGIAEWLVDDIIGLWTGDPDEKAIMKAREGRGDRATLLVEIEVSLDPNRE